MLVAFSLVWLVTAIAPRDRGAWLLENVLVVAFVAALVATYRRFRFSVVAYTMIAILLCLHAIGAHYTYSGTPVGRWMADLFGWERNHYDRAIHFAFGAVMARPLHELLSRGWGVDARLARHFTPAGILAVSALYELIESWTALLVDPAAGAAFLGTQGDEWDSQRDMTSALVGAVLWWLATFRARRRRSHFARVR